MITVNHLTKRYGSHLAVDDISFTVQDGEIVGFLGPNGAGKSTTMNMLTGYISSSSGEALINDINILDNPIQAKRENRLPAGTAATLSGNDRYGLPAVRL